jgi:hypothetical protein
LVGSFDGNLASAGLGILHHHEEEAQAVGGDIFQFGTVDGDLCIL